MRVLLLAAVLLSPDGDKDKAKDSPLKPLCAVVTRYEKGMAEYLKGAAAADAWKPWTVTPEGKPELREAFRAAGIETGRSIGFELYVTFVKAGRGVYNVRAEAFVTPTEASLFNLTGRAAEDDTPRGLAASACNDQTAPFGEAAAAFAKAAKTGKPDAVPFADRAALEKRVSPALRDGFLRGVEAARKDAQRIFGEIAKLDFDEVYVHADDHYGAGFGADGSLKEGILRTKFRLKADGAIALRLSRLEKK